MGSPAGLTTGMTARTSVPPPLGLSTSSVPSSAERRSARPRRPEPRAGSAPPTPSSRTWTITRPFVRSMLTEAAEASAYLTMFASASETTKYAAASIRGGSRSSGASTSTGMGEREASISRAGSRPRSLSTAGWMPRASSRSSSSAWKSSCSAPSSSVSRLVRRLVDLRAREPQRERQRDEALLRAVVEIPLQAAALGRLDLHDPLPRRPDLALVGLALRDVDAAEQVALLAVLVDHRDAPPGDSPRPGAPCEQRVLVLDAGLRDPLAHLVRLLECLPDAPPCTVLARPAGDVLDGAVEADDRPVGVDHAQQARDRVGHRLEEVALGQEGRLGRLAVGDLADDQSVSSAPAAADPALVVAQLAADRRARTRSSARPRRPARARSRAMMQVGEPGRQPLAHRAADAPRRAASTRSRSLSALKSRYVPSRAIAEHEVGDRVEEGALPRSRPAAAARRPRSFSSPSRAAATTSSSSSGSRSRAASWSIAASGRPSYSMRVATRSSARRPARRACPSTST